jgi:hypothetical protein
MLSNQFSSGPIASRNLCSSAFIGRAFSCSSHHAVTKKNAPISRSASRANIQTEPAAPKFLYRISL